MTVDGAALHKESKSAVTLFGKGYALAVDGIVVSPGQKDEVEFAADFSKITYTTHKAETPTLLIGIETVGADYEFDVHVAGETAGQHVELSIDMAQGTFTVHVKGDSASKPTLSVELTKIDKGGEQTFKHKGLAIADDQSVVFSYAAWKGNKTPLHASVVDAKGAVVSEEDEADEE